MYYYILLYPCRKPVVVEHKSPYDWSYLEWKNRRDYPAHTVFVLGPRFYEAHWLKW
jgi:hypothetical protein